MDFLSISFESEMEVESHQLNWFVMMNCVEMNNEDGEEICFDLHSVELWGERWSNESVETKEELLIHSIAEKEKFHC